MDIIQEIIEALRGEDRVMVATIISTSGSTPVSAFSKMLIRHGGTTSIGTVGGGCLEGDVLKAAKRLYETNKVEILTFHLNEDEFVQGLICGGSLDILIEPISRELLPVFKALDERRSEGEDTVLATVLSSNGTILSKQLVLGDKVFGLEKELQQVESPTHLPREVLKEELRKTFRRQETRRVQLEADQLILEPVQGTPNLIIFGGGHVSRSVCKVAAISGFRVTVVDDREQYANPVRFPEASRTLVADVSTSFSELVIKPSTYIVIVTRGHRNDEEILEQALKTPAKYIGMIGSKRKVLTTYEHLVERGASIESLKRVHAPIGVEIGAVTAEEIGVSIVAELIAVRRGEQTPYFNKSVVMHELFSRLEKKRSLSPTA